LSIAAVQFAFGRIPVFVGAPLATAARLIELIRAPCDALAITNRD
jgi:hypothetical protein